MDFHANTNYLVWVIPINKIIYHTLSFAFPRGKKLSAQAALKIREFVAYYLSLHESPKREKLKKIS